MKVTMKMISEVAMVGEAKVRKDAQRGNLDVNSLSDVVRYVYGHRLLAGGLKVFDGIMHSVAEQNLGIMESVAEETLDSVAEKLVIRGNPLGGSKDVGAGMTPVGFSPSYTDGQCDDTWEAEY